jgi:hypothetical protein
MRKKLTCAVSLLIALGFAAVAQASGPAGPAPLPDLSHVLKAHACHNICELGPAGWHYHSGPACTRRTCAALPAPFYIWRCDGGRCGWWHPTLRRWF